MGAEHARKRKHLLLYPALVLISFISLSGCTHLQAWQARERLRKADLSLQAGDHGAALAKYMEVLDQFHEASGDSALLRIGFFYARPDNPNSDFGESIRSFERLQREFPQSAMRDEAAVCVSVLKTVLELREDLSTLENTCGETEQALQSLEKEVGEKEKMIARYQKTVNKRQVVIDQLKNQISELQSRLDKLQARLTDLKKVDMMLEERRRTPLQ